MHDAHARPQQHFAVELAAHIAAQMPVGAEDDFLVFRYLADDRFCARAGDDDVAQRFNFRRTVDVSERDVIRMRFAEGFELLGRAAVFKTATSVHVRQNHDLFRAQDLGRIGHELHAAKNDHVGICLRSFSR